MAKYYEDEKRSFFKRWNNRYLEDWGSVVSKEYRTFQNAFIRLLKRFGETQGAEVVNVCKGHYFTSCFIKRVDKEGKGHFVYVHHSCSCGQRTYIQLNELQIMIRTAESEKDYHGGFNHYVSLEEMGYDIFRLLY